MAPRGPPGRGGRSRPGPGQRGAPGSTLAARAGRGGRGTRSALWEALRQQQRRRPVGTRLSALARRAHRSWACSGPGGGPPTAKPGLAARPPPGLRRRRAQPLSQLSAEGTRARRHCPALRHGRRSGARARPQASPALGKQREQNRSSPRARSGGPRQPRSPARGPGARAGVGALRRQSAGEGAEARLAAAGRPPRTGSAGRGGAALLLVTQQSAPRLCGTGPPCACGTSAGRPAREPAP